MSKETRNLVIVGIIALLVGYIAGGAMQTGRCPITGMVLCKDRAAACDKAKACCAATCSTENEAGESPAAAADASK